LERIGHSLRSLKNMSHQIGDELEDQSGMLDELGTSISGVESRMNEVMKKLAKLTRLEDGLFVLANMQKNATFILPESRQWTTIFVLIGLIVVLLIVLVIL
jgi:hypothetical protein